MLRENSMEWASIMKKGGLGFQASMMLSSTDCSEEFEERDIWDALPADSGIDRHQRMVIRAQVHDGSAKKTSVNNLNSPSSRRIPTASRMIPRTEDTAMARSLRAKSAPMNIPDWSKLRAWKSNNTIEEEDADTDDGDDADEERIPPHELVARQLARSQISSFSVMEGAGRTLKGRDVIKVRNAVLTRTGFLE